MFGGPLTTTFLMSLATPVLVLPFERIALQGGAGSEFPAYADDAGIDPQMTERLTRGLGGPFGEMPFFRADSWSVVETSDEYFRLAEGVPQNIAKALADDGGHLLAARIPAMALLACLRNALSHGGISYLDANGRTTNSPFEPVSMLAFVSVRMKGKADKRQPAGLRIARVSEENFRTFLREWVAWLSGD